MKTSERGEWQADPERVQSPTTGVITLWDDLGGVVTAQMTIEKAKELVKSGRAFVISSGNVGMCEK